MVKYSLILEVNIPRSFHLFWTKRPKRKRHIPDKEVKQQQQQQQQQQQHSCKDLTPRNILEIVPVYFVRGLEL